MATIMRCSYILRAYNAYNAYKQCAVMERTMDDGSFGDVMLLPERLDGAVPDKSRVSLILSSLCLSRVSWAALPATAHCMYCMQAVETHACINAGR